MFVGIQFLRLGVILGLIYYSVSCILWAKIQKKVRIREAAQVCLNSLNQRFFFKKFFPIMEQQLQGEKNFDVSH